MLNLPTVISRNSEGMDLLFGLSFKMLSEYIEVIKVIVLWYRDKKIPKKHRKKLTNLIIWETQGFSHEFSIVRENAAKPILWEPGKLVLILLPLARGSATKPILLGEPGKLVLIFFPYYECFFTIRFPSYGILYHMRNSWISPLVFHSTRKCNKTHLIEKTWEIGTHKFPIIWLLFPNPISILWYTSSYGK